MVGKTIINEGLVFWLPEKKDIYWSAEVNIIDNTIEYSTSKIVNITSSNVNSGKNQGYGANCYYWFC